MFLQPNFRFGFFWRAFAENMGTYVGTVLYFLRARLLSLALQYGENLARVLTRSTVNPINPLKK